MNQVASLTKSATLDFVYNGQHLNKATLDFSEVIRLAHSKKKFESSEKDKVVIEKHKKFNQTVLILLI